MDLSLDGIEALEAIADEGSFAAASRTLNKTQSAISYSIKALERALGVSLFDRSGHRAVLTPAGVAVLDEGRFLLARARRIQSLGARFAEGWEARLRLVVDGALPRAPLLKALHHLGQRGIPTHVQVRTEFRRGVPARFRQSEADLMVALDLPPTHDCMVRPLPDLVFVLVAKPDHPAACATEPQSLEALQRHLELSVHDSAEALTDADTNLLPGARVFYVGDFGAKKDGLLMGLGLGWMPLAMVSDELADERLVEVPFERGSRRRFTVSLAWRVDQTLGPTGRELVRLLEGAWS